MNEKELREAILVKNEIILQQAKRIKLLEEKIADVRRQYFQHIYPVNKLSRVHGKHSN